MKGVRVKVDLGSVRCVIGPPQEPTVVLHKVIRHPDGSPASEGVISGDELYEANNFLGPGSRGSKYELADKLREMASMFASHERPEDINATVLVVIRRRPRPSPIEHVVDKKRRRHS